MYPPASRSANFEATSSSESKPKPRTNPAAARPAETSGGAVTDGHARSAHAKIASSSRLPAVPSSGSADNTPHATSRTSLAVAAAGSSASSEEEDVEVVGSSKNKTRVKSAAAASGALAPLALRNAATMAGATPVLRRVLEVSPAATASRIPAATHLGAGSATDASAADVASRVVAAASTDTAAAWPRARVPPANAPHASAAAASAGTPRASASAKANSRASLRP